MNPQTFTIRMTSGTGGCAIRRGDIVDVGCCPMRVTAVALGTVTVRYLRWYERAWLWVKAVFA